MSLASGEIPEEFKDDKIIDIDPKGVYWGSKDIDILVCYSTISGTQAAKELIDFSKSQDAKKQITEIGCPVLKSQAKFDIEYAEKTVARCNAFVLMITEQCLQQTTVLFTVKCAFKYGIKVTLVHDLSSCAFPNPSQQPNFYQASGMFDDKAITYISSYKKTSHRLLMQQLQSDQIINDFAFCYAEGSQIEIFSLFEHISHTFLKMTGLRDLVTDNLVRRMLSKIRALIVVLSPELEKCYDQLGFILRTSAEANLRCYFVYEKKLADVLVFTFESFLHTSSKAASLEYQVEELVQKFLDHYKVDKERLIKKQPIKGNRDPSNEVILINDSIFHFKTTVKAMFPTMWYEIGVEEGKWYYEVEPVAGRTFQIGWTYATEFMGGLWKGIGDDELSYAYDGQKLKKWNGPNTGPYGDTWKPGDIVGCCVDVDNQTMSFTLNGRDLGVAFSKFMINDALLYPGLSAVSCTEAKVNVGLQPFRHLNMINNGYKPLVEAPMCKFATISYAKRKADYVANQILTNEAHFGGCLNVEKIKTHAFLSHKRSSAQGIAGRIFEGLRSEFRVFLDTEASFNLHNLELIVKQTGLFIFILSEGIFDSYWCLQEFRAAVRYNRRILVVRDYNFRFPKNLPKSVQDVIEIINKSENITYMAEFHTDCVSAIRSYLGPACKIVDEVDEKLQNLKPRFYKTLNANLLTENSTVSIPNDQINIKSFLMTVRYYYGATTFANIRRLTVAESKTTDEELEIFSQVCVNCKELFITDSEAVTDEGLRHLGENCRHLEKLDVTGSKKITDKGLEYLSRCAELKYLALGAPITDAGLKFIASGCTLLRILYIQGAKDITDTGVDMLTQGCRDLKEFVIRAPKLTDRSLIFFGDRCVNLERFNDSSENNNITDVGVRHLTKCCTKLTELVSQSWNSVTDNGFEFVGNCQYLEILDFHYNPNVTDKALEYVGQCPNLWKISFSAATGITGKGLNLLSKMPVLVVAYVSNSKMSDEFMLKVSDYWPILRVLSVGSGFTDAGMQRPPSLREFYAYNVVLHDHGVIPLIDASKDRLVTFHLIRSPVTDKTLEHLGQCDALTDVRLDGAVDITNAGLSFLSKCTGLKALNISGATKVTEDGLKVIMQSCTSLKGADFHFPNFELTTLSKVKFFVELNPDLTNINVACPIQDEDWDFITKKCTNLKEIHMNGPNLSNTVLGYFAERLTNLDNLTDNMNVNSSSHKFDNEGVKKLLQTATNLTALNTPYWNNITDEALEFIGNCRNFSFVNLNYNMNLTDQACIYLSNCPKLAQVYLWNLTKVTENGVSALVTRCHKIYEFDLARCVMTDRNLMEMGQNLPKLQRLAAGTQITDVGLGHLSACTELNTLYVYNATIPNETGVIQMVNSTFQSLVTVHLLNTSLTDAGLRAFAQCPKLTTLNISGATAITDAGLKALAQGARSLKWSSLTLSANATGVTAAASSFFN